MIFCSSVSAETYKSFVSPVFIAQKGTLRAILMIRQRTSICGLFWELTILELGDILEHVTVAYVYISLIIPNSEEFPFQQCNQNTRKSKQVLISFPNSVLDCCRRGERLRGLTIYLYVLDRGKVITPIIIVWNGSKVVVVLFKPWFGVFIFPSKPVCVLMTFLHAFLFIVCLCLFNEFFLGWMSEFMQLSVIMFLLIFMFSFIFVLNSGVMWAITHMFSIYSTFLSTGIIFICLIELVLYFCKNLNFLITLFNVFDFNKLFQFQFEFILWGQ